MDIGLVRQILGIGTAASLLLLANYVLARRRRFGRVLVRLGRYRQHRLSVGVGLVCLALGASQSVALGTLDLVTLSIGAGFVFMGLLPLEMRERGIVSRDNAYPWSRLVHWRWVDPMHAKLELRVRLWWSRGVVVIPIPPDKRDLVGEILADRAGASQIV